MLAHVLLLRRTSSQNLMVGAGLNPNGGISLAPVAKARMTDNVTVSPEGFRAESVRS